MTLNQYITAFKSEVGINTAKLVTLHFFWSSGVETGDVLGVPSKDPP